MIALFELCNESPEALVTAVESREVTKARPVPLSRRQRDRNRNAMISDTCRHFFEQSPIVHFPPAA